MNKIWDLRYGGAEYIYGKEPNQWVEKCLSELKPGKILLPADGEGRNGVWAARMGWAVYAFDMSERAQTKALALAKEFNVVVDYRLGDATLIEYPTGSFDAIAVVFLHLPEEIRQVVFKRLITFLKPGGHLIVEAFTKRHFGNTGAGPKDITLLYDPEQIKEDLMGMDLKWFEESEYLIDEGPNHQGKAISLKVLAQKADR